MGLPCLCILWMNSIQQFGDNATGTHSLHYSKPGTALYQLESIHTNELKDNICQNRTCICKSVCWTCILIKRVARTLDHGDSYFPSKNIRWYNCVDAMVFYWALR